jgi:MYXO-CTERM domain-containing protein
VSAQGRSPDLAGLGAVVLGLAAMMRRRRRGA